MAIQNVRRETIRAGSPAPHIICSLTHIRRSRRSAHPRAEAKGRARAHRQTAPWPPRHSRGPPRLRAGRPSQKPPLPPRASSSASAPSSRRPRPASPPGAPRWPARPPDSARARVGRASRSSPWPAVVSEHLAGSAFLLSSFLLWTCVVAVVRYCECASLGTVAQSVLCRGGV
jgi:hypothetical protein